ncbi:MAG: DUF2075 domain-containing protein [Actinomycetia bacterium]|nr:DUF2075 domain-containing protein [Actinomycetes bacterium]
MRLYSVSSKQFIEDAVRNQIAEKLSNAFFNYYRFQPSPGEKRSWVNSLTKLSGLLQNAELLDHGIILEFQLPQTSRRLDFLICGKNEFRRPHTVIVELKQWEECKHAEGDREVQTFVGGAIREVLHPSAQVGGYEMYLRDTHTAFYGDDPIELEACSYLHNYHSFEGDVIFSDKFQPILNRNPVFTADDYDDFVEYLNIRMKAGEGLEVLKEVEESEYRPSKKLMNHVGNIIKNKKEYILLDDQLIVYDKVFSEVRKSFHSKNKSVIIAEGGPGTGKSIIALNLMADLLLEGYNSQYATGSKAFTETLRSIIGNRGSVQFKYFNSYINSEHDEVDVLICDEAHRLRETSNNRFTPRDRRSDQRQIEEIINVARVPVFFIDDNQVVRPNEIGSVEHIREYAEKNNCNIFQYKLDVQFRCSGSEGFINWVNNTLNIQRTANIMWSGKEEEFDFQIMNSPFELEDAIKSKIDAGYTGRLAAGFCWKWSKPDNNGNLINDVVIGDFQRPWNARHDARGLAKDIPKAQLWAHDPNGINQIGCIYTAQGFEFDYIGVIIGNDLRYDFERQEWIGIPENLEDNVVKRSKDRLESLLKNSYRVLLTRGMKGCYVYFMDKSTRDFVRSRIEF